MDQDEGIWRQSLGLLSLSQSGFTHPRREVTIVSGQKCLAKQYWFNLKVSIFRPSTPFGIESFGNFNRILCGRPTHKTIGRIRSMQSDSSDLREFAESRDGPCLPQPTQARLIEKPLAAHSLAESVCSPEGGCRAPGLHEPRPIRRVFHALFSNSSRPISMRRISLVPAPIS